MGTASACPDHKQKAEGRSGGAKQAESKLRCQENGVEKITEENSVSVFLTHCFANSHAVLFACFGPSNRPFHFKFVVLSF